MATRSGVSLVNAEPRDVLYPAATWLNQSMEPLLLRAAIKRGGLLVTANWPVVLIDFAVESFCRFALALPVLGGALMVTTVVGVDLATVVADGLGATADLVLGSLSNTPAALAAFLVALALVAVGGEVVIFVVKAGTLAVLVEADATVGEVQRLPLGMGPLRRANVFRLDTLVRAGRHFASRAIVLSVWLGVAYAVVATLYLGLVTWGTFGAESRWLPAWSLVVLVATSAAVVVVVAANLAYTLLRVVIVTDDCQIRVAVTRLLRFVIEDARQVIGIFSVIGGIEIIAAAASLLTAAGLAPIAYLPIVSVILLPLQAAIWILRGLVFEALSLASVAAYQTQYRRFSRARWPPTVSADAETDWAPGLANAAPPD
jgi:hypothetical protein